MDVPFLRTPYNYDRDQASDLSGLLCEDESLTVQSAKEDADINTIVRRFGLTGQLPDNVNPPQYGDYTGVTDYRSALHAVMEAEESFMALPADIRSRFHNDPQAYLEFFADDNNRVEAERLGLINKKAVAVVADSVNGAIIPTDGDKKPS